jgi:hypothetical protein
MKSSIESVVDTYETRIKIISDLMRQMVATLKEFDVEQEERIEELREFLSKTNSLRKKDFNTLIAEIWNRRKEKEKKVDHTLENFLKSQGELVACLRKVIVSSNMRLEDFKLLSQNILIRQKKAEGELSRMLRELHLEQEELEVGLKKLFQRGKNVRIKDFKALIEAIQLRQAGREDEIGKMLDELWHIDKEVAIQWHKVVSSTRMI